MKRHTKNHNTGKRCKKKRYRDRVAAELTLAVIDRKDNAARGDKEVRAYRCERCRGFHLTHKPMKGRG